MKVDILKKLIKEACREAVREELRGILGEAETVKPTSTPPKTSKAVHSVTPTVQSADPLQEMLSMTRESMTRDDYKNILGGQNSTLTSGLAENFSATTAPNNPEPGLDISQFDFIKNASKVFNASVEKDKQRFGG